MDGKMFSTVLKIAAEIDAMPPIDATVMIPYITDFCCQFKVLKIIKNSTRLKLINI